MIGYLCDFFGVVNLPCRKQTELLSRQQDGALRPGEAAGLRLHLLICGGCRRFRAQLDRLRAMARALAAGDDAQPGLPESVRGRLLMRLQENSEKSSPSA